MSHQLFEKAIQKLNIPCEGSFKVKASKHVLSGVPLGDIKAILGTHTS